jgi:hypothetical protein
MEKTLKVFISVPMKGKTDIEIAEAFEKAKQDVRSRYSVDIEFLDSFIRENPPECKNTAVWFLGKSIEVLANADLAYFAKGWYFNRGCKSENRIAHAYEIPCIEIY